MQVIRQCEEQLAPLPIHRRAVLLQTARGSSSPTGRLTGLGNPTPLLFLFGGFTNGAGGFSFESEPLFVEGAGVVALFAKESL